MAGIASSSSSSSEDLTQTSTAAAEPVDVLLQRRKCELMFELKKLQHGERPVTGSDSRGKVDSFLSKRVQRQDSSTPVANEDDVEEHRPQQITIEVQGLLQRRSVSSILQSEGFRRSLENTVRSHLAPPTSRNSQSTTRTASVSQPATRTASASQSAARVPQTENAEVPVRSAAPSPPSTLPTISSEDESAPTNNVRTQPVLPEADRDEPVSQNAEAVMRRWNHEHFVMEISELVHRQLVSSTLQGDFRHRLERHVAARIEQSGRDGRSAVEQIQSLPPSNIRRNDFSHLGIIPVQDQQLDDAVSVISATASASIPYAQSNAAVHREMSAMKAQIAQLSNMLKMSLDLQMDIQRSIRQEVAAAINQTNASNSSDTSAAAASAQLGSRRADDSKCIVCIDENADAVLYRCGHICMCYSCALRMRGANGQCPVCRAPISDILRAYRISHDL